MIKKAFCLLGIGVFLVGCGDDKYVEERAACKDQKGAWRIWNNAQEGDPSCNLPTSDTGKICTDSSQCESWCWVASPTAQVGDETTGKCYKWQKTLCMQEIKEGIVQTQWCE